MGAASVVGNVTVPKELMMLDIWVMLAATIALTVFILRRTPIGRKTGIVLLIAYALYMATVASRFVVSGAGV